jgi:hypothetical protein
VIGTDSITPSRSTFTYAITVQLDSTASTVIRNALTDIVRPYLIGVDVEAYAPYWRSAIASQMEGSGPTA